MANRRAGKSKPKTTLWWIGLWATIWWGVTGIFVLVLIWQARHLYVSYSPSSAYSLSAWRKAVAGAYSGSGTLPALLTVIISVWIIGGLVWLRELNKQRISYRSAFKDLFLTIRK